MIKIKALKKIISVLCVVAVGVAVCPQLPGQSVFAEDRNVVYYVSPNGNDYSAGTIDAPLASLEGVRNKIRSQKKKGAFTYEVIFRGGEYRFLNKVDFTKEDSGTEKNPIVYRAMEGETPVFKASVEFKNPVISKVADESVLKRIQENVRDKVVAINLEGQIEKSQIRDNTNIAPTIHKLTGGEPNFIFIDDKQQTISEWPNGDGNYTYWTSTEDGRTISFEGTNPIHWTEAKDWYIGGYNEYDWRYARMSGVGVDPVNKTITVSNANANFKFTSYQSRRFKAFNLLEEIDLPGEFYIDRENMVLYIYPPYSLKDAKIEMTLAGGYFLNLSGAQNITFKGLTFTQCCDDAVKMAEVRNIDFLECNFRELASMGIYCRSTKLATTDASYWQVQDIDASYDCDIKNCVFYDIGSSAIEISGGNVDTLTPSNNVIENNVFNLCQQTNKCTHAVELYGCGHKFIHNNMSRATYQGVYYSGNDMEIMYNEIHDVVQETDDAGAVYCGRNSLTQGSVIAYNYIHEIGSVEELVFGHQCGIYWDDHMVGQTAYNNIIKDVNKNIYTNGIGSTFRDNTSIDLHRGGLEFKNGGASQNTTDTSIIGFGSVIANPDIYYNKYPNLKAIIEMMKTGHTNPELAKFSVITGNLDVNSAGNITGSNALTYATFKNNIEMDTCEDFVDPAMQDYRIKSGSPTAKQLPGLLDDTFDIEQIGIQYDVPLTKETSSFRQLYPENGQTAVSMNNLQFKWEDAFGATKYRLVIATDRELKNVVYDEIAPYSVHEVDSLERNKVYYWKVYAMNTSRELNSTWESSSPVYTFSTALYEKLNTDYFDNVVNVTKEKAETIVESNETGDYKVGTKEQLNSLINRSSLIANMRLGAFSQAQFDILADNIGRFFQMRNMVNPGPLDFGKYIEQPEKWIGGHSASGGEISVVGDAEKTTLHTMTGINSISQMTGSVIYCFDAKMNIEKNFIDIGINKDISSPQWAATNAGYSLVIKPDVIELQRATGTVHGLLTSVNYSVGTDWHEFEFGWVDIGVGNLVILNIDGEPVIEWQDVSDPVNSACNFCVLVYNNGTDSIALRRTANPMTMEEYEAIVKRNTYQTAKTLIDSIDVGYSAKEPFVIVKNGASKVLNEEKVVDITGSPVTSYNGSYMIPVNKIGDILLADVTENGGNYTVTWNEKSTTLTQADFVTIEGVQMTSLENLLNKIERAYVKEEAKGFLVVGNIVTMNNSKTLNNLMELIDKLETLGDTEDVAYQK